MPKVNKHVKFDDPLHELRQILQIMEENWENKLPIIESNCNVKFSLVHLLYTSDSHYTFYSFCSHHKCVEVINDPGGSTAPLRHITHGSLKEKNNKEDGKLQCFLFFSFFFLKKKAAVFLVQTLQPNFPAMWYN